VISAGDWVSPDAHGWVLHPASDAEWTQLVADYGGRLPDPLKRIVEIVRGNGCKTVVVENRYVDLDYRSEYSKFWSLRFEVPPPFARRLHFFRGRITDDQLHNLPASAQDRYLGYSVIRPIEWGSVGRTMIVAPRRFDDDVLCKVTDSVSLFGTRLTVEGVPFYQQDTEYMICAHAAVWVCHYTAALRSLVPRRATATLADHIPAILSDRRPVPSQGLNFHQIQAVFGALEQPAVFYSMGELPRVPGVGTPVPKKGPTGTLAPGYWDTRIFSVVCRYLNSGFPVLVGADRHAIVLTGWRWRRGRIQFIATDDQVGPYLEVDPFTHYKSPWQAFMVPMPPKVMAPAESAEVRARAAFLYPGQISNPPKSWRRLRAGVLSGDIVLRTRLLSNLEYKQAVTQQGRAPGAVRALRLARLPRFVWVVEAHDRDAKENGKRPVRAEALFDPTSSERAEAIALQLPGSVSVLPPSGGKTTQVLTPFAPWKTLGPGL